MRPSVAIPSEGKYDFSQILLVQQDMRKGFRNLALSRQRFLKQIGKNHEKFFQNILQHKRQMYYGRLLDEGAKFRHNTLLQTDTIEKIRSKSQNQSALINTEDYTYKLPEDAYPQLEEINFIECLKEEIELEKKNK